MATKPPTGTPVPLSTGVANQPNQATGFASQLGSAPRPPTQGEILRAVAILKQVHGWPEASNLVETQEQEARALYRHLDLSFGEVYDDSMINPPGSNKGGDEIDVLKRHFEKLNQWTQQYGEIGDYILAQLNALESAYRTNEPMRRAISAILVHGFKEFVRRPYRQGIPFDQQVIEAERILAQARERGYEVGQ